MQEYLLHAYISTCIHTYTCMHARIHAYVPIHIHTSTHTCIYTYMLEQTHPPQAPASGGCHWLWWLRWLRRAAGPSRPRGLPAVPSPATAGPAVWGALLAAGAGRCRARAGTCPAHAGGARPERLGAAGANRRPSLRDQLIKQSNLTHARESPAVPNAEPSSPGPWSIPTGQTQFLNVLLLLWSNRRFVLYR